MIYTLLGKSIEQIFEERGKPFSLKTVCMLGIQMIDRLDYMHYKYIIHRDIKPDNFVIGLNENKHIIYIIDMGLYKKYYYKRTQKHIEFKKNERLTGTPRYASINNLKGYQQSRRDDLESLGYTLLYLLKGILPWQGIKVNTGENRNQKILELKESIPLEELCKDCPHEFIDYINYSRNLQFEEKPDYDYLKKLFYTVLDKNKYEFDFWYDWVDEKPVITDKISAERYINRHCIEINNIQDYNMEKDEQNINEKEKDNDKKDNKKEENNKNEIGDDSNEKKENNDDGASPEDKSKKQEINIENKNQINEDEEKNTSKDGVNNNNINL